jgi:hypothetical protein
MDRRDWELLDKQIRPAQPAPPPNGVLVAMLVGLFILGATTGALLFAPGSTPHPTAGDGTAALAFFLNGPRHETP